MGQLFISHSHKDNFSAQYISNRLKDRGWKDQFLDIDLEHGIMCGENWQNKIYQAGNYCQAVIFLISQNWLASEWCKIEFELARKLNKIPFILIIDDLDIDKLDKRYTRDNWQIVNLYSGHDHGQVEVVELPDGQLGHVSFSQSGLKKLERGLLNAGLKNDFFTWPPANEPNRPPYPGLSPLQEADAGIFFGRDIELTRCLARIKQGLAEIKQETGPYFLTLLGASGSGKSSFLRAGLLPRLARDARHFYTLPIIRPERAVLSGNNGLYAALEKASQHLKLNPTRDQFKEWANDPENLSTALSQFAEQARLPQNTLQPNNNVAANDLDTPPTLVLAIDQAEELFNTDNTEAAEEASRFLDLLGKLLKANTTKILVITTIRTNAYHLLQNSASLQGITPDIISLPALSRENYTQIIEGPAKLLEKTPHPLSVQPELTKQLCIDLQQGDAKDALPLLAFTLEQLWRQHGGDGNLRLEEYKKLDGIQGALQAAINQALQLAIRDHNLTNNSDLPNNEAECLALLRKSFIPYLAGVDQYTKKIHRRVALLTEIPENSHKLLDYLVTKRLLTQDQNAQGQITLEAAHESLLRLWPELNHWLKEEETRLINLDAIQSASKRWSSEHFLPKWLIHTQGQLHDAEQLLNLPNWENQFKKADRDYLAACRNKEQSEIQRLQQAVDRANIFKHKIEENIEFMTFQFRDEVEVHIPTRAKALVMDNIDKLREVIDQYGEYTYGELTS